MIDHKKAAAADQIDADSSVEATFLLSTAIHVLATVFALPTLGTITDKLSNLKQIFDYNKI